MSTSSDTQKGKKFPGPPFGAVQSSPAINNPGLTLLKGILWIALIAGAIAGLAMNYEIVWDVLAEAVPVALEVAEETLDTFYEKVVGLNPGFAQMATAYTGFIVFLAGFYLLSRKAISIYKRFQAKKVELSDIYSHAWSEWFGGLKAAFLKWWNSLDLMNKAVAVVFGVLIGIPIALLISYVLGSLVASLV